MSLQQGTTPILQEMWMVLTQAFVSIPFLYEISSLLEWTAAETTLHMKRWISVEEIHRILYEALYSVCTIFSFHQQKRIQDADVTYYRALPRHRKEKFLNGGLLLTAMIVSNSGMQYYAVAPNPSSSSILFVVANVSRESGAQQQFPRRFGGGDNVAK